MPEVKKKSKTPGGQLAKKKKVSKGRSLKLKKRDKESRKLTDPSPKGKKQSKTPNGRSPSKKIEKLEVSKKLKKRDKKSRKPADPLAKIKKENKTLGGQLIQHEREIKDLSLNMENREAKIRELNTQLAGKVEETKNLNSRLKVMRSQLKRQEKQLSGFHNSTSWQLTAPLRWAIAGITGISYFFKYSGTIRRIKKSGLFDEDWYLNEHLDVMESDMDPLKHYVIHGCREGRQPTPWFDEKNYIEINPDAAQSKINPFLHYCIHGDRDGVSLYPGERPEPPESIFRKLTAPIRWVKAKWVGFFQNIPTSRTIKRIRKSGLFDGEWYLDEYPDIKESGMDPLEHYVRHGHEEGRKPASWFDGKSYALYHPEVLESGENPFLHYYKHNSRKKPEKEIRSSVEVVAAKLADYSPIRPEKLGIRFYGPVNRVSGLGVPCRGLIRGLQRKNFHTEIISVNKGFEHQSIEPIDWIKSRDCSQKDIISIVHLNADAIPQYWPEYGKEWEDSCYKIGVWSWELSAFRPDWVNEISRFNEIWNSSTFMNTAIQACTNAPVTRMPPSIQLPEADEDRASVRERYKIKRDAFMFLYMFDASSFLERKNPLCLLNAFIKEFGEKSDAVLVLKMAYTGVNEDALREIKRLCDSREDIILIRDILTPEGLSSLLASADCYVSPHRAEGFGLSIIEAMMLNVPVIATGYSGSNDFVTPETAFPIDYSLIEIEEAVGPYLSGYMWAEPKEVHLQEQMRKVFNNEGQVEKKVKAAKALVIRNYSVEAVADRLAGRIDEIIKLTSAGQPDSCLE